MKNPPCKDCEFRNPGCHGSCELYKEWRKPAEEMQRERDKGRTTDTFLHDNHYRGWKKYKRK